MITTKLAAYERALRAAAEEAYQSEVVDTAMERLIIGNQEFADKEDWIEQKMEEWMDL